MIEVFKQTLEAFEIAAVGGRVHFDSYAEALRQAIAKLESQEPMATIAVRWHEPVGKVAYVLEVNLPVGVHKLYTHPPRRTWVGLSDEEIKAFDAWHDNREEKVGWCNPSEIVAYIEAKLKEKNT
jgi:hypothetical protein